MFYNKVCMNLQDLVSLSNLEFGAQFYYQRYIYIFSISSILIYLFGFYYFYKRKFLKDDKEENKFIAIALTSILFELFSIILPFISLKIGIFLISKLMFNLFIILFSTHLFNSKKNYKKYCRLYYVLAVFITFLDIYDYRVVMYKYLFLIMTLFIYNIILSRSKDSHQRYNLLFFIFNFSMCFLIFKTNIKHYDSIYIITLILSFILIKLTRKKYLLKSYEIDSNNFLSLTAKNIGLNLLILIIFQKSINNLYSVTIIFSFLLLELIYYFNKINEFLIEYNAKKILYKLRIFDSIEEFKNMLEKECMNIFKLKECRLIYAKKDDKEEIKNISKLNYYNENLEYLNNRYDLGIKLEYLNTPIALFLIKDPKIFLYNKKILEIEKFLKSILPLLDKLLISSLKIEYYSKKNKQLKEELVENQKELFYADEIIKLIYKKSNEKNIKDIVDFYLKERDHNE